MILILQRWIFLNPSDFEEEEILKMLTKFIHSLIKGNVTYDFDYCDRLLNSWERAYLPLDDFTYKSIVPKDIIDKDSDSLTILDFNTVEVAKQLTLIDYNFISNIKTSELLKFEKWGDENECPNMFKFITWYNKLACRITSDILLGKNPKKRAKLITKYINIAERLITLQNFHSSLAIASGLGHYAVSRLVNTWKHVDKDKMNKLEQLTSPLKNFRNIRLLYDASPCPFIPPQAILSRDMFFIDQGNNTYIENDIINADKLILFGNILFKFILNTHVSYRFIDIDLIQNYIKNGILLSEEELDNMSSTLETV